MQRPRTVREIVALPRGHLIRGAQIPIAHRGWSTRSHSRGFLPWRLSDAGRQSLPHPPSRPASETLHILLDQDFPLSLKDSKNLSFFPATTSRYALGYSIVSMQSVSFILM